jgi:ERCC4-related helicase
MCSVAISTSLTEYHTKYYAYELTKRYSADSLEKLASTFAGAKVDLNPHQLDAALFAFGSPLSRGALLADEVGLGKTIEAGLVISQKWAERQRKILVISPSNLRKQWQQELSEKFFLPCTILESKTYKEIARDTSEHPFDTGCSIIICSYQFARSKANDVESVAWDLVVIDEAHRLRNVYKSSNIIANTLKRILQNRHKLLLTATPLQNSLLELFGLVSFIDDRVFGDLKSFREQFAKLDGESVVIDLKERLKPICHRTLRRQVTAYVPFTRRHAICEEFTPSWDEERLYDLVSEYLHRDNLQALPTSQRALMTLVMRKLLASSTFAIAKTLSSLSKRLKAKLQQKTTRKLSEELAEDYEELDETIDEWGEDDPEEVLSGLELQAIESEIKELDEFIKLADSIEQNAKGEALLKVLEVAFKRTENYGGDRKALIFTESRRTQEYLLKLLGESAWGEGLLLFNGSNTDDQSKQIYRNWLDRHQGTDKITGSKTADMRSALVDYFREQGSIMIATEAGSEGINLQFCSLLINYDLPWNPQRVEQRIGRCHRYGQKHDVVVVNFLNQKNAADKRVFELLDQKFQLFEGVFGCSDEVLGAIESGVDFEKRIADIYQRCRQPEEIDAAFDKLQQELSFEINKTMVQTRQKLLENFDDEVREKLKVSKEKSDEALDRFEKILIDLTRYELAQDAEFVSENSFRLERLPDGLPTAAVPLGVYELPRRSDTAHTYRMGHPLAEMLVQRAQDRVLAPAEIQFDYSNYEGRITILEPFGGMSGNLSLSLLKIEALGQIEDYLVFAAVTEDGEDLDPEIAKRLMSLPGRVINPSIELEDPRLDTKTQADVNRIQQQVTERNANFFEAEAKKLDSWADDRKVVLDRDIKEMDRQIKEAKRAATAAVDLQSKLAGQKQVKALEMQRNQQRRSLFDAQDEVDRQRDELIAQIEGQLAQKSDLQCLFKVRWNLG